MRPIVKRNSLVSIWLVVLTAVSPVAAQTSSALTQAQAVEIAERFVAKGGYSDEAPNAIASRAVIAGIKTAKGQSFWSVQFLFRQQPLQRKYDFGREVKVSLDGTRVWMGRNKIPVWRHMIP
jgi:hypothetical protein